MSTITHPSPVSHPVHRPVQEQPVLVDPVLALDHVDIALKAKHRAMWASGDDPRVSEELLGALGHGLVAAAAVGRGQRVLDVGAGSGNAAVPAALTGADVVAADLTPELFLAGRRKAAEAGAELRWEKADAEALPYADASYDVVMSCLGVMFAPHHLRAAAELVRVCRPGGRVALVSWTPEGLFGQLADVLHPYAAPQPDGVLPPTLWGSEPHVRALLGDAVRDVRTTRAAVAFERFTTGAAFRDYFKAAYGPVISTYHRNADERERIAELDVALELLGERALTDGPIEAEYLLLTATRV